jgi:mannose-6-phosphate isomerase-like protein (cupin superfamily)
MRLLLSFLATAALVIPAPAPSAATPSVTYYSAADLKSLGTKLGADSRHAKFVSKNLETYSLHYTMLAHREGDGSAELHVHEADLFFVVDGEATIITGGKMVSTHTEKPGEIRGTSITGGDRRKLSTGDVIHIAANTPHQLVLEPGKQFTYFVMKIQHQ